MRSEPSQSQEHTTPLEHQCPDPKPIQIATHFTWTIIKNGLTIELTLDDIRTLFEHLSLTDHLLVFDPRSRHCTSTILVSVNGGTIQLTLHDHDPSSPAEETRSQANERTIT